MTDNEIISVLKDLLTPINIRMEKIENEIAEVKHEMSNMRLDMNRGFRKNNDEIETIVAVLEAKNILPMAK